MKDSSQLSGRRTKYTEDRIARFLEACRRGSDQVTAAAYAGWSHSALYDYLLDHPDLRERMKQAQAEALQVAIDCLLAACTKDWRAAAWFIQRRGGTEWNPTKIPPASDPDPIHLEADLLN